MGTPILENYALVPGQSEVTAGPGNTLTVGGNRLDVIPGCSVLEALRRHKQCLAGVYLSKAGQVLIAPVPADGDIGFNCRLCRTFGEGAKCNATAFPEAEILSPKYEVLPDLNLRISRFHVE